MKSLKEYLRTDKTLKNLKISVKRRPKNYTLGDRIKGEKPKKLITRVDILKGKRDDQRS